MINKIFLSSDHGGFELKEKVKNFLLDNNFEYEDLGCSSLEPVDYPDFAKILSKKIKDKNKRIKKKVFKPVKALFIFNGFSYEINRICFKFFNQRHCFSNIVIKRFLICS